METDVFTYRFQPETKPLSNTSHHVWQIYIQSYFSDSYCIYELWLISLSAIYDLYGLLRVFSHLQLLHHAGRPRLPWRFNGFQ